jgi:HlyD family secretion protein
MKNIIKNKQKELMQGMIADENNRLKKQYVVTGRTVYGSAVEIKSGLTEDDRIAFPYGKNAVEGAAVTDESSNY